MSRKGSVNRKGEALHIILLKIKDENLGLNTMCHLKSLESFRLFQFGRLLSCIHSHRRRTYAKITSERPVTHVEVRPLPLPWTRQTFSDARPPSGTPMVFKRRYVPKECLSSPRRFVSGPTLCRHVDQAINICPCNAPECTGVCEQWPDFGSYLPDFEVVLRQWLVFVALLVLLDRAGLFGSGRWSYSRRGYSVVIY